MFVCFVCFMIVCFMLCVLRCTTVCFMFCVGWSVLYDCMFHDLCLFVCFMIVCFLVALFSSPPPPCFYVSGVLRALNGLFNPAKTPVCLPDTGPDGP